MLSVSSDVSAKCTHSDTSTSDVLESLRLRKYSTAFTSWFVAGIPSYPSFSICLTTRASSREISASLRNFFFSSAVSVRIPTFGVSESAMRYSHSTRTRARMSENSLKYSVSADAASRYRPSMELIEVSGSNGILFQVLLHTRDNRLFACDKLCTRDLLIHLNIAARHLFYKLRWCGRKHGVFVRVRVLLEPQAKEFFVEVLWFLLRGHTRFVAFELPVARRVRRVYLVDNHERSVLACPEFILRVNEYQTLLRGDLLPARKERERRLLHILE